MHSWRLPATTLSLILYVTPSVALADTFYSESASVVFNEENEVATGPSEGFPETVAVDRAYASNTSTFTFVSRAQTNGGPSPTADALVGAAIDTVRNGGLNAGGNAFAEITYPFGVVFSGEGEAPEDLIPLFMIYRYKLSVGATRGTLEILDSFTANATAFIALDGDNILQLWELETKGSDRFLGEGESGIMQVNVTRGVEHSLTVTAQAFIRGRERSGTPATPIIVDGFAESLVDPVIMIDPSFEYLDQYTLIIAPESLFVNPDYVPEPSAALATASALLTLVGLRIAKRRR